MNIFRKQNTGQNTDRVLFKLGGHTWYPHYK